MIVLQGRVLWSVWNKFDFSSLGALFDLSFLHRMLIKKNVCDPFKSIWPKFTESVLRLLWGHVTFLFQFLFKCKKLPRVWNRLMHGAGVSYVGLLWSYTSNYSITLIYFLIGWLFQEDISKRKRFNGWHAKSWLSNCCFLPAKQRVSLIKFAKLKWATEEK